MIKLSLLAVTAMLALTTYAQNKKIDWNTDLDYLAKELSEKHYNFFTVKSKEDFLSGINAIKQKSEHLNDFQVALKAQQLIARFGDSHTVLNFDPLLNAGQKLPIYLLWTSDGLHVIHTTPENKKILGSRVLSINDIPIATVIDSLSTLYTIDNQAVAKLLIPQAIPSLQILEYFGFADAEGAKLGLHTPANQKETYWIKPSEMNRTNRITIRPDSIAFSTANQNRVFTDFYFSDEKIHYILYNKCLSKEVALVYGNREMADNLPSFQEFEEKVFTALAEEPVEKIVFDIRYNGGGSSAQGTAFAERLATFLKENPTIKTYVVLGRATFSSAIINAMDFKRLTNAVFVGEETAGKPNHFGEVRGFQLPASQLKVRYSTNYFKYTDENTNTIIPDIAIEMSFSDFMKGIDPVYEWVKKQ